PGSARPAVRELAEQSREFPALRVRERLECDVDGLPPLAPEPANDRGTLIREDNPGPARVVGVRLPAHQSQLDDLLDEPRGARLVDTDRFADLAHRQRTGCCGQRIQEPHPGRTTYPPAGQPGWRSPVAVV